MAMINDAQFSKKYSNNTVFEGDLENKKVYVVSLRDIEPGEELFVSYGEGYWATPSI
jgi:SET domain-containing protein